MLDNWKNKQGRGWWVNGGGEEKGGVVKEVLGMKEERQKKRDSKDWNC